MTDSDVDPVNQLGPRIRWEDKGNDVQTRGTGWRSPYPSTPLEEDTGITEEYFRSMMEMVLPGIRKQTQWVGMEREKVGLAVEQLSDEQRAAWQAIQDIHKGVKKSGLRARNHNRRSGDDLERLAYELQERETNRGKEIRLEQEQRRAGLLGTIARQIEQH